MNNGELQNIWIYIIIYLYWYHGANTISCTGGIDQQLWELTWYGDIWSIHHSYMRISCWGDQCCFHRCPYLCWSTPAYLRCHNQFMWFHITQTQVKGRARIPTCRFHSNLTSNLKWANPDWITSDLTAIFLGNLLKFFLFFFNGQWPKPWLISDQNGGLTPTILSSFFNLNMKASGKIQPVDVCKLSSWFIITMLIMVHDVKSHPS